MSEQMQATMGGVEQGSRIGEAVQRLLRSARLPATDERRGSDRSPFFGPVTISLVADECPKFSAFARDISPVGIGLLHIMPLEESEVVVNVPVGTRGWVTFRTQIVWCKPCGDGWYSSGGRFLDVVERS